MLILLNKLYLSIACTLLVTVSHGSPLLQITADDLHFQHKVITEEPTRARTVRLRNTGNENLQFTSAGTTITGAGAAHFILQRPVDLDALTTSGVESSQTLLISFAPQSAGNKTASLEITTNDPVQPVVSLPLNGTGLTPRLTLHEGEYTGYGPGKSIIGSAGNYTSLYAACEAFSSVPLTGGDWVFEIQEDLTETSSVAIVQSDTNGNTVTFRPAEGTSVTVTFNEQYYTAANIRIGWKTLPTVIPTSNVVFDGSSVEGGRNLTLQNTASRGGVLVYSIGDCDNITLRNCRFLQRHSHPSPLFSVINIDSFAVDGTPHFADSTVIDDCEIYMLYPNEGSGITHSDQRNASYSNRPGTLSASYGARNILVRRCDVRNTANGILLGAVESAIVDQNTIQTGAVYTGPLLGIGVLPVYSWTAPQNIQVSRNNVQFVDNNRTVPFGDGVSVSRFEPNGCYEVVNNCVTYEKSSFSEYRKGIATSFLSHSTTAIISHNSVHIPAGRSADPRSSFGIGSYDPIDGEIDKGALLIHNNIVRIEQENAPALKRFGSEQVFISDYNDLSTSAPYVVRWAFNAMQPQLAINFTSLEDFQTSTGQDLHSIQVNPFEPVAAGLGTWIRNALQSDYDIADLHFTSYPGDIYKAPARDTVSEDIDGEPRTGSYHIIGSDEPPAANAGIETWVLY